MFISKTPLRVSFFGGGTDFPNYFYEHGGAFLSTTIDKYVYVTLNHLKIEEGYKIKYSKNEYTKTLEDIKNLRAKEFLRFMKLKDYEVTSISDLPGGTGLGSSSAYLIGLFMAIGANKERALAYATDIELNTLKEPIGIQDHIGTLYGGMKFVELNITSYKINQLDYKKELEDNLVFFYLGKTRKASKILLEQKQNNRKEYLDRIKELAYIAKEEYEKNNFDKFGSMLLDGWKLKTKLASGISNPLIEKYIEIGLSNGALGVKLLGAGGSGFLMFYCPKEKQKKLLKAINLKQLYVKFEQNGSRLIYSD